MPAITVGNKLYLYKLLSREVGTGRQVTLARIEETLLADDIWPSDLDCKDVRELLEQLDAFVRLTIFKKGRAYATILVNEEWEAVLERAESGPAPKAAEKSGAKSWKRRKSNKDPKPAKPRPKGRPEPAAQEADAASSITEEPAGEQAAQQPQAHPRKASSGLEMATTPDPKPMLEPVEAADSEPEPDPGPELVTEPEPAPDPEPAFEPTLEPEQASEPVPTPEPTPEESPQEGDATSACPERVVKTATGGQSPSNSEPQPQLGDCPPVAVSTPKNAPLAAKEPPRTQTKHPSSFAAEVLVRDRELSALYQMLPLDVDPFVLLDEDWRVAQSTEAFTKEKGLVTFPLRYCREPKGEAVRVSLRRMAANHTGKRWVVESVDRVDEVGFNGLPTTNTDVMRELAQFSLLGSWEDLAKKLAHATDGSAAPLPPAEMRDYLCITFHRIQCEHKAVVYDRGRQCAFDTGLLNSHIEPVLMRFRAIEGDVAWQFVDFCTPDEAQLANNPPLPATYLSAVGSIEVFAETDVRLLNKLIRSHEPGLRSAIDLTLRRIRRDCRLAAPAYDPITDEVLLLAPIVLPDDSVKALVLSHDNDGFVVNAIIPLDRAATHARIVSRELPRWLEG